MRFAYYPGCSAKASTQELDTAVHWLAPFFGIELVELVDAGCCGSCEVKAVDPALHLSLNARILSLAAHKGLEILTVCDTCQSNLHQTGQKLDADPAALEAVMNRLHAAGVKYARPSRVRHFLKVMIEEVGLEQLKEAVVRPLTGLKVAPFACCHSFRGPGAWTGSRANLDDIVRATGATTAPAREDGHCCGFHILMTNEDVAARAAGKFLSRCKDIGADCVVTSSPLCHTALDIYQSKIERANGEKLGIPIIHVEQLLGLSFGGGPLQLGLDRHLVSTGGLLRKYAT